MASGSAAYAAKKGVGMLFNATKMGLAAVSQGITMVRKGYADKHESMILEDMRKQEGKSPTDYVVAAFRRIYFLYLAGYKNEIAAAGRYTGKRLTSAEKSSIPLDAVIVMSHSVTQEALKYGDFEKNALTLKLQDYRNKSRMGKDHFDRDSVIHDMYYALLLATETCGTDWFQLEQIFRDAVTRVVEHAINGQDSLPAQDPNVPDDRKKKAAKALFKYVSEIKALAVESENERLRGVKDAEETMKKEQERLEHRSN